MTLPMLDLDLEIFSGPFDLLLALVLREEVDLLDLELADVVLAYLDHLEGRGELDLETATEFIVLIAALLELKSRLMLAEDSEELLDIEPGEAAEELLERMLQARRYRSASVHLLELFKAEEGVRFRSAPLPASLRKSVAPLSDGSQDAAVLGAAIGRLLRMPPTINLRHISIQRVTVAERLDRLRTLLKGGDFSFEEAVRGEDRMTVAVTVFALLELYKRGEAWWEQDESFGEIAVHAVAVNLIAGRRRAATRTRRMSEEPGQERPALEDRQSSADQDHVSVTDVESEQLSAHADAGEFEGPASEQGVEYAEEAGGGDAAATADPAASVLDIEGLPDPEPHIVRTVEALLFLAPDPLSPQELSDAAAVEELAVIAALAELAERYAPGRSGINLRELGGGFTFASDPETEESARRLFSRPRASVLTPAQAETLAIVAYLQPISRPEITRIRGVSADSAASTLLERGLVEESGRSQFGAVMYRTTTQFLKLFGLKSLEELPDIGQWDPSPDEEAELRDRLLRAGEARAGGGPQPELQ